MNESPDAARRVMANPGASVGAPRRRNEHVPQQAARSSPVRPEDGHDEEAEATM